MSITLGNANLHQQDTDFEIIESLLPYIQRHSFIDIGAEKGTFTHFLSQHQWKGVLFEPLPKFADELTKLANDTHCTFLPFAVDQTDRTADFYIASDHNDHPTDYFSSLHPLHNDQRIQHTKATTVTCRSLDSLLQEGLIPKEIGLVKVDTEGNDLNVLKGMHSIHADVLMCEYFMPGIYAGWVLGHPQGLIEEAKKMGFQHYVIIKRTNVYESVSVNNADFMDKQWGNLIFMREPVFHAARSSLEKLMANKESALLKQVLENTEKLTQTCAERLQLIHQLNADLAELRKNRSIQAKVLSKVGNKLRAWLQ